MLLGRIVTYEIVVRGWPVRARAYGTTEEPKPTDTVEVEHVPVWLVTDLESRPPT